MSDHDHQLDPRSETELRRLAYRDHLTALPNRIALADRIEGALVRSAREGTSTALLFVDIDGFKRINDTLGHAAGDELLALVAERFRALPDSRITTGRHGGDEFLLLVEDLPSDPPRLDAQLEHIGDMLAAALRAPFTVARSSFEVTASAGASVFPRDARSHSELIDHADQAMYASKRRGRAQTTVFALPEQHSLLEIEATLRARRALERGQFQLYYQPVIEIADGRQLGGLEALLRWHDPDRGMISPDEFLGYIEHSTLLEEIGEWVLSELCRQLAEWSARGFSPRISFNIPARQLRRVGFAEYVIATAERHGVELSRLAAEITETSPVSLEEVLPTLEALDETGFVLSLDDFGTGYSSLARLRAMPFTLLKTDRSFMHGVPGDPVAEELIQGIVSLGNTLGLKVIVEGVESAEQEQALLRLGARIAQGYHLGGPAPPSEIEARWNPSLSRRRGMRPGYGPPPLASGSA